MNFLSKASAKSIITLTYSYPYHMLMKQIQDIFAALCIILQYSQGNFYLYKHIFNFSQDLGNQLYTRRQTIQFVNFKIVCHQHKHDKNPNQKNLLLLARVSCTFHYDFLFSSEVILNRKRFPI